MSNVSMFDRRLPDRFWSKVAPCPMSGCWLWTGGITSAQYGLFSVSGVRGAVVQTTAHRHAYATLVAPVAPDRDVDHICKVRLCCNPAHLRAVTHRENLLNSASASTVNAGKTHCPHGHEYSGDNLYTSRFGRQCRACRRATDRRRIRKVA